MTDREASSQITDYMRAARERSVPVEKILGQRTLSTMIAPDWSKSYIVRSSQQRGLRGLEGYVILAEGPELNTEQIRFVQKIVFDPKSYYHGTPRFRRFPHKPNFALRFTRDDTTLDLMIDLYNRGWDFCCGDEYYSSWHWADFRNFAKSLFPEFASPSDSGVWKKAMKRLVLAKGG